MIPTRCELLCCSHCHVPSPELLLRTVIPYPILCKGVLSVVFCVQRLPHFPTVAHPVELHGGVHLEWGCIHDCKPHGHPCATPIVAERRHMVLMVVLAAALCGNGLSG